MPIPDSERFKKYWVRILGGSHICSELLKSLECAVLSMVLSHSKRVGHSPDIGLPSVKVLYSTPDQSKSGSACHMSKSAITTVIQLLFKLGGRIRDLGPPFCRNIHPRKDRICQFTKYNRYITSIQSW